MRRWRHSKTGSADEQRTSRKISASAFRASHDASCAAIPGLGAPGISAPRRCAIAMRWQHIGINGAKDAATAGGVVS